MQAAILGVVGVAVGALLTGLINYLLSVREERALSRAAELLVRDEFLQAKEMLEAALKGKEDWPNELWPSSEGLPTEAWTDFRERLTPLLDVRTWAQVQIIVTRLQRLNSWVAVFRTGEYRHSPEDAMRSVCKQAGDMASQLVQRSQSRRRLSWGIVACASVVSLGLLLALLSSPELNSASLAASLRGQSQADLVVCDPIDKVSGQWVCSLTYEGPGAVAELSQTAKASSPRQELWGVLGDDDTESYFASLFENERSLETVEKGKGLRKFIRGSSRTRNGQVGWRFLGWLRFGI